MSTEDELRSFIVDELGYSDASALSDDLQLIKGKVLDSLGIFKLVSYIEERYEIEVLDDELRPANFETIGALAGFVRAKQGV